MSGENDTMDWAARAKRVIPGGVNSGQRLVPGLEDLVVVSTAGATFTDSRGRTFTDYHSAFGPPLLGHNDPDVDAAMSREQARNDLMGIGVTPVEIELAERIVEHVPSVERVLLTATGSEATFHAIRLARTATGRNSIIKFQGCYHGWHDSVAMNVISPADRVGRKDPLSGGILQPVLDATIIARFNDLTSVEEAFASAPGDVAAIILEPIPHNIGAVLPTEGFLEGLRRLCTQNGTVLIFDEVITGFRHGLGGYQSVVGVMPDLTTMGKAMANGYPISAIGGRADLMDMFSTTPGHPAFFAGTFNGHPAMAAAALATIRKLEREPVYEHIFKLGEKARSGLQALYDRLGVPAVVEAVTRVLQSDAGLLRNDVNMFLGYRRELLNYAIFELPLNLKRNHVSYAHSEADIDALLEATEGVIAGMLNIAP